MKKINRELFDSLPTSFTSVYVDNIVTMARQAEKERNNASLAYTLGGDEVQRLAAVENHARYTFCRDLLLMVGKESELTGVTNE